MREFVIKALRNYGYRFLDNQSGCYTFGKPLGYGILRADVREDENSVSVMLIVKGNEKDGKCLVKYRPRKQIANALTSMAARGIADPRDGLGNTTPHIVYEFE